MKINNKRSLFTPGLLLLPMLLLSGAALAQKPAVPAEQAKPESAKLGTAYSPRGADTCLKCHDEDSAFPVYSIFKTSRLSCDRSPHQLEGQQP
jgi:hypothetical protein